MGGPQVDVRIFMRVSLLAALVAAATRVVQIPMPATQGYVNIGDAVIIAGSLILGGPAGGLAAGIGSALADLLGGYFHWAPFTLVIKGLEGLLIGSLAQGLRIDLTRAGGVLLGLGASILGLGWMVLGYFLVEWPLYSLPVALAGLTSNGLQAVVALIAGFPLAVALGRRGIRLASGHAEDEGAESS